MKISRLDLFKGMLGAGLAALLPKMEAAEAPGANGGYLIPEPLASQIMKAWKDSRRGGSQEFWLAEAETRATIEGEL